MSTSMSRRTALKLAGAGLAVMAHEGLAASVSPDVLPVDGRGNRSFRIDIAKTSGTVSPLLFGHNLEHTRRAVWQGISGEKLANRKFAGTSVTDRRAGQAEDGFIGKLREDGRPGPDGVAAHWYALGKFRSNFYVDRELPYAGSTSQRIDVTQADHWGGIGQGDIALEAGGDYAVRVVLRTHYEMQAQVRIVGADGDVLFAEERTFSGNEWHEWDGRFSAQRSSDEAKFEILFKGKGSAWVGAASLLPQENFRGLRRDVIARLKEMSVPILRWPGGNFVRNWVWKDGLLPVDRRTPTMVGSHETLVFTDNYDFNEIGIDDFMALCEELGAIPSLTLNLSDELENAKDLVEYCNGTAETRWGRIRAERGHPQPYNVKYWSIGNETFGPWLGHSYYPPDEYAKQIVRFSKALLEVDPTIELVAAGYTNDYTNTIVKDAGAHFDIVSAHYYGPTDEADSLAGRKDLDLARRATLTLRSELQKYVAEIDAGSNAGRQRHQVSLDEWNLWPWWFIMPFEHAWHSGPLEGMYAASALNLLCREANELAVHSAMYFQPVNEGCIDVSPHDARLTPAGQAYRAFQAHHGNTRLDIDNPRRDEFLDLAASHDRETGELVITLLNRDNMSTNRATISLKGLGGGRVAGELLEPVDLADSDSVFALKEPATSFQRGTLEVAMPPYSIAILKIPT